MVDKDAHYLMCKGGVFYFTRHVPNDLQCHYARPRIVMCLKTRSKNSALKASHSLASKLDDFWLKMRISQMEVPAAELLIRGQPTEAFTSCTPKLSDALDTYCRLKGAGRTKQFFSAAQPLKTASSARIIPLVGSAKWAAERILAQPASSQFAFPNYNDGRNQPSTCGR